MDLTPYVSALRDDLAAAAAVGDEATSRAGSTLAAALEPAVRLALMNALSDLAGEIDAALPEHRVALRLRGRELDVAVERQGSEGGDGRDRDPEPAPTGGGFFAGPSSSPFAGPDGGRRGGSGGPGFPGFPGAPGSATSGGFGEPDVGDISRMTLRIVDQIKGQAERAAAAQGMSLNSWVSQAVQGALRSYGGGDHGREPGGGWSGRARWSGGRPADEETPPAADTRPSSSGPDSPGGTGGPADGGTGTGPGDDRRDDRRDDPGDGGVQGWVRG